MRYQLEDTSGSEFPTDYSDVSLIVSAATLTVTVDGVTKSGKVVSTTGQVVKIQNIFDSAAEIRGDDQVRLYRPPNPSQTGTTRQLQGHFL